MRIAALTKVVYLNLILLFFVISLSGCGRSMSKHSSAPRIDIEATIRSAGATCADILDEGKQNKILKGSQSLDVKEIIRDEARLCEFHAHGVELVPANGIDLDDEKDDQLVVTLPAAGFESPLRPDSLEKLFLTFPYPIRHSTAGSIDSTRVVFTDPLQANGALIFSRASSEQDAYQQNLWDRNKTLIIGAGIAVMLTAFSVLIIKSRNSR
ncbi:hypothetical protein [Austwickia chelonae]|uniref:hypothetical protein n=1 Tax=Austwickia chelonae TaxID=100225 RepID=UPI0013C31C13|nr:hypothetical protein [Austwickia chelonae]